MKLPAALKFILLSLIIGTGVRLSVYFLGDIAMECFYLSLLLGAPIAGFIIISKDYF